MFYTSFITSLLPYLLLLGVFGTLLVNQFRGADTSTDPRESSPLVVEVDAQPGHSNAASPQQITPPRSNKPRPSTQVDSHNPPLIQLTTNDLCQAGSAPFAFAGSPALPVSDLNRTFSLRGPPAR